MTTEPRRCVVDRKRTEFFSAARVAAVAAGAHSDSTERGRRLHPTVVASLTDAGFARHFVPRPSGGAEGGYVDLLAALAPVAEECPSAAWCAGLWAMHGRFAAYLPLQGQRELWASGPDVRISAAVMPPAGTVTDAPEGLMLSGGWDCVSGVHDAQWLLLAAPDATGGGPHPESPPVRVFAVPADAVRIVDTWHSVGLRGTGSHSVHLEPLLVPWHRTFLLADLMSGMPGPGRVRCHTVPARLAGGLGFAAAASGAARRMLREWCRWAEPALSKSRRSAQAGSLVRETLGRASAEIEAGGLLLENVARRADTEVPDGRTVAGNQRDLACAAELFVTAAERLFRTGGAHAMNDSGILQRCWRDVHTATAHGALRADLAHEAYAQALFGEVGARQ